MKTFKKTLAWIGLFSMLAMNVAMAAQIGTGSITGSGTSEKAINWDSTFGALSNASGSVDNVLVTASVDPVLNMVISTGSLALGTLDTTGTGRSLDIELGTNATSGLNVKASSTNWGLKSATASWVINNDANWANADGIAESYKFSSVANTKDSSVTGFTSTGVSATEVNTVNQEVTIYTSDRPEKRDNTHSDVTFTVFAKSAEETAAASDYSDTITFTVTGNF